MSNNMLDDAIIQEVLNEVNAFTGASKQSTIGFINLFSIAMRKLMEDYKNKSLMIQDQQKHIVNLEKELEILKGKS